MHRNNYGFKQVVTEGEFDTSYDYAEDAERQLAIDSGSSQESVSDTPGAQAFGGIVKGLVVTRSGTNSYVEVSAGEARDYQGRLISIPATRVSITFTGDTPIGTVDTTGNGVVGDGASIAGSVSDRVVCSLFAVYDEIESDERLDGALATYYFDIAESFHFNLEISAGFTDPPTSNPGRQALDDGKVLLTDLVLEKVVGAMQVVSGGVCNGTSDWAALTGYYANLSGRRSDNTAIDNADGDFPLTAAAQFDIRGNSARVALYDFVKQLQNGTYATGDPDGAALVASRALAAAEELVLYSPVDVNPSSIAGHLASLSTEIARKVNKGGDLHQAFFDDFMYRASSAGGAWDPDDDTVHWTKYGTSATFGVALGTAGHGGVVKLTSDSLTGAIAGIRTGVVTAVTTGTAGFWFLKTDYGARARVRVKADPLTDVVLTAGFAEVAADGASIGNGRAEVLISSVSGTVYCRAVNTSGSASTSGAIGSAATNDWEVLDIIALDDTVFVTRGSNSDSAICPSGDFGTNSYLFFIQVQSADNNTDVVGYVDAITVSDIALRA